MRGRSGAVAVDGWGSSHHVRVAHHPPALGTAAAGAVGGGSSVKRSRWCGANQGTRRLVGAAAAAVGAAAAGAAIAAVGDGFGHFFLLSPALPPLTAPLAVEPGSEDGDDGEDVFR
eukprot:6995933-Prymnesium_polylepis.1